MTVEGTDLRGGGGGVGKLHPNLKKQKSISVELLIQGGTNCAHNALDCKTKPFEFKKFPSENIYYSGTFFRQTPIPLPALNEKLHPSQSIQTVTMLL